MQLQPSRRSTYGDDNYSPRGDHVTWFQSNALMSRQHGQHFANNIVRFIFLTSSFSLYFYTKLNKVCIKGSNRQKWVHMVPRYRSAMCHIFQVYLGCWDHFLSLARSKLRLCTANHRPGYWNNLPCDWPSTAWAYSEQETENGPWIVRKFPCEYSRYVT